MRTRACVLGPEVQAKRLAGIHRSHSGSATQVKVVLAPWPAWSTGNMQGGPCRRDEASSRRSSIVLRPSP
eukprot:10240722-Alexandrium_andersonii.AAC.1